jgi:hypothetical protein
MGDASLSWLCAHGNAPVGLRACAIRAACSGSGGLLRRASSDGHRTHISRDNRRCHGRTGGRSASARRSAGSYRAGSPAGHRGRSLRSGRPSAGQTVAIRASSPRTKAAHVSSDCDVGSPGTAILGLSFWCGYGFLERRRGSRHDRARHGVSQSSHQPLPAELYRLNLSQFKR